MQNAPEKQHKTTPDLRWRLHFQRENTATEIVASLKVSFYFDCQAGNHPRRNFGLCFYHICRNVGNSFNQRNETVVSMTHCGNLQGVILASEETLPIGNGKADRAFLSRILMLLAVFLQLVLNFLFYLAKRKQGKQGY